MIITLQRRASGPRCTIGELRVDGQHECWTLEDLVLEIPGQPVSSWKVAGKTAIPAGRYRMTIDMSTRFKKLMLRVLDVPGFEGIRIHTGNTAEDTEGCILVGQALAPDGNSIKQSALALESLQPKIQAALDRKEEVWIDVLEAPSVVT